MDTKGISENSINISRKTQSEVFVFIISIQHSLKYIIYYIVHFNDIL